MFNKTHFGVEADGELRTYDKFIRQSRGQESKKIRLEIESEFGYKKCQKCGLPKMDFRTSSTIGFLSDCPHCYECPYSDQVENNDLETTSTDVRTLIVLAFFLLGVLFIYLILLELLLPYLLNQ